MRGRSYEIFLHENLLYEYFFMRKFPDLRYVAFCMFLSFVSGFRLLLAILEGQAIKNARETSGLKCKVAKKILAPNTFFSIIYIQKNVRFLPGTATHVFDHTVSCTFMYLVFFPLPTGLLMLMG